MVHVIIFVFEVFMSIHAVVSNGEPWIVERISQWQNNDIYFFFNSSTIGANCGDKNIYLISEDQCVKNQELLRDNLIYIEPIIYTPTVIIIQDADILFLQFSDYI